MVGWVIGNVALGLVFVWLDTWCWRSVVDVRWLDGWKWGVFDKYLIVSDIKH